ncbi:glycine cleavage system protein GcvH [Georgenia sp. 10Sc9-8]|uniref:Glycine cleavage system H protein n=1 Tax=Georgenia halotolerans TaxID=3028317 RepID=A0ABT5TWN3_9MICO|nr:glycine cleavage system protein GcvH [Georgenia halotolerans]
MSYPTDREYTRDHEWIALDGDVARVGLTGYAAEALGEAVFVDPPAAGDRLSAGAACGEIESVKSVSDLIAPADGEVLGVNQQVVDEPSLATSDPYEQGWLYTMRPDGEPSDLLDAEAYAALVEEEG